MATRAELLIGANQISQPRDQFFVRDVANGIELVHREDPPNRTQQTIAWTFRAPSRALSTERTH
jgi:hypothetical protein